MDTLLAIVIIAAVFAVLANLATSFGTDSRDDFRLPDTRMFS